MCIRQTDKEQKDEERIDENYSLTLSRPLQDKRLTDGHFDIIETEERQDVEISAESREDTKKLKERWMIEDSNNGC